MGLILKTNEILEDTGEASADFLKNAAIGVKDGVCNLWDKYRDNWVLGGGFTAGVLNSICQATDSGGDGFPDYPDGTWQIILKYRFTPRFGTEPTEFRFFTVYSNINPYRGSISNIEPIILADGQLVDTEVTDASGRQYVPPTRLNTGSGSVVDEPTLEYLVSPVDSGGGGDIEPSDLDYIKSLVTSIVNGQPQSEDFQFSIKTNGNDLSLPITVCIDEVCFVLDVDGVGTKTGNDFASQDFAGGDGDVPPPGSDEVEETPPPNVSEEDEVEDIEVEDKEIIWVLVEISTFPIKGKSILASNQNDNDYFAGYFSWLLEDDKKYRLETFPIRKQFQAFKAPENIGGYSLYSVNGAKLKAKQVKKKVDPFVPD